MKALLQQVIEQLDTNSNTIELCRLKLAKLGNKELAETFNTLVRENDELSVQLVNVLKTLP